MVAIKDTVYKSNHQEIVDAKVVAWLVEVLFYFQSIVDLRWDSMGDLIKFQNYFLGSMSSINWHLSGVRLIHYLTG